MLPDGVAGVSTHGLGQSLPQHGGLPQLSRPQLQADQGGERLLGRAAGGPPPAQRFTQCGGARDPLAERRCDHGLHPALDQRQQDFQPFECLRLLRRRLWLEDPLGEELFHCRGIAQRGRVEAAREVFDAAHVDLHALGVSLDGTEQLTGQPRHVAEQPVMRCLPGSQEGHDLAARLLESGRQLFDGLRHQRCYALGTQREADIGRRQHLARQPAECLAELRPERHTAHLRHHGKQWPGHGLGFLG